MILTMKNFIKTMIIASLLFVPALAISSQSVGAQGTIEGGLCDGVNLGVGGSSGCADNAEAEGRVQGLITLVINIFSIVVGIAAVIMIIIGGLKYITSSGDSNNITGAKNTILYAIIGLVVVALAQIIVQFVLSRALGADGTSV